MSYSAKVLLSLLASLRSIQPPHNYRTTTAALIAEEKTLTIALADVYNEKKRMRSAILKNIEDMLAERDAQRQKEQQKNKQLSMLEKAKAMAAEVFSPLCVFSLDSFKSLSRSSCYFVLISLPVFLFSPS